MQAYGATLADDGTRFVISPDTEFFRFLNDPSGSIMAEPAAPVTPSAPSTPGDAAATPGDAAAAPAAAVPAAAEPAVPAEPTATAAGQ